MLSLHQRVSLRPEPFGALAYHYDSRKLVFLRHPDVLTVVRSLDGTRTVAEILEECGVARLRWPAFDAALSSLLASELICEHVPTR